MWASDAEILGEHLFVGNVILVYIAVTITMIWFETMRRK